MNEASELYRREQIARRDAMPSHPAHMTAGGQGKLRRGVVRIVENRGNGNYKVREQWYDGSEYVDATSPPAMGESDARDYLGRDHGQEGAVVRFWQQRKSNWLLESAIDVGHRDMVWTARIVAGKTLGCDSDLHIGLGGKCDGFWLDEVDPVTLNSFAGSRTRDENNNYIPTHGHNTVTTLFYTDYTIQNTTKYFVPLPCGTLVQVRTVVKNEYATPFHLFNYPITPWPAEILGYAGNGSLAFRWTDVYTEDNDAVLWATINNMPSSGGTAMYGYMPDAYPLVEAGQNTMIQPTFSKGMMWVHAYTEALSRISIFKGYRTTGDDDVEVDVPSGTLFVKPR